MNKFQNPAPAPIPLLEGLSDSIPNMGMMTKMVPKSKPMAKPKAIPVSKKPKTKVTKVTPSKRKPHRAFTKKKKSV